MFRASGLVSDLLAGLGFGLEGPTFFFCFFFFFFGGGGRVMVWSLHEVPVFATRLPKVLSRKAGEWQSVHREKGGG